MFRTGLERIQRLVGTDNQVSVNFLNDLSVMLSSAGRYREALIELERSIAMERKLRGGEASALSLANLGSLQEEVGDYEQAVASMSRAVELMRANSSASYHLRQAEANLARALSFAGRHAAARELFEKVRSESKAAGEAGAFDYAFDTFRQGVAERLAGRLDAASALLEESVPVLIATLGEMHRVAGFIKRQRGQLAIERGDLELARADLAAARGILEKAGASAFDLAFVDLSLATLAAREGDEARSRSLLAAVLPQLRDNVGPRQAQRVEAEQLALKLGMRL